MAITIEAVENIIDKLETKGNYACVSYSYADKEKAYELIGLLLQRGVKLKICKDNDRNKLITDQGCKCLITLLSKNYIYDPNALMDQYMRFSNKAREKTEMDNQIPCMVIDLDNKRGKYKDDIDADGIAGSVIHENMPEDDVNKYRESISRGLYDLYRLDGEKYSSLIKRQTNAICEGDADEVRRQMSFILDYDGHLDNVLNMKNVSESAANAVKKLSNQGVDIDEKQGEICRDHFDEWGKRIYSFSHTDGISATIVCSDEKFYIKKNSMIKENPCVERTKDDRIKDAYRRLILKGIIKPSREIGYLVCTKNVVLTDFGSMDMKDVSLFVCGSNRPTDMWKDIHTNEACHETTRWEEIR